MNCFFPACLLGVLSTPVLADVTVKFHEGAPKDRFEILYTGTCPLTDVELKIDLGASNAGLILDTTGAGAGVSVYQPLEVVTGKDLLVATPAAKDGDTMIVLSAPSLSEGDRIVFTTDVDDTKGSGPTMISGAEITGAQIVLHWLGRNAVATFDKSAKATVAVDGCNA